MNTNETTNAALTRHGFEHRHETCAGSKHKIWEGSKMVFEGRLEDVNEWITRLDEKAKG